MSRVIIVFILSVLVAPQILAQDILVLNSKERVEAKVVEVGIKEIKYRKFSNPNGPLYSIAKSDIFLIMYENGTQESFESEAEATEAPVIEGQQESETANAGFSEEMLVSTNRLKLSSRDKAKMRQNDLGIYRNYTRAKTTKTIFGVIGGVSSVIVIASVVNGIINFDANDPTSVVVRPGVLPFGVVSIVAGFFQRGPKRRMKEAMQDHNADVRRKMNSQTSINLGISSSGGIGLVMRF